MPEESDPWFYPLAPAQLVLVGKEVPNAVERRSYKVYGLSYPYLLYKKVAVDTELLQPSFEGFGVCAEESFRNDPILNHNKLAGVRERPLSAVHFEHSEFR